MLSPLDLDILTALCRCIKVATAEQLAAAYWPDRASAVECARQKLGTLAKAGFVSSFRAHVTPLPVLDEPLVHWHPGDWIPDFGTVAWQLAKRWQQPLIHSRVFMATTQAARTLGGKRKPNLTRRFQVAHDVGVSAMYFAVRQLRPRDHQLWVDEERLAPFRRGQKLPDAVLAHDPAAPLLVLEFGGKYSKDRLQAFHEDCEDRGLPYEIW